MTARQPARSLTASRPAPGPQAAYICRLHSLGARISVLVVVVGGSIGTLIKGRIRWSNGSTFFMFGLTIGGIYALIALGYTMVYGILRLINFAHGDITMTGAFSAYFLARGLDRSGFPRRQPGHLHGPDHGAGHDHLLGDRPRRRAHLLSAVPACRDTGAADLRHRRIVLPAALVPRHVRLHHPRLSGP